MILSSTTAFAQWIQKSPTASPPARTGSAIDFVPQNVGLIMFGGGSPFLTNETWLYDGATWVQLNPTTSPSGRAGAHLVYDSFRGVAVLYGGLASNISIPPPTNETWEWDGTTWSQATPTASAGNRYQYGACFDALRGRVVMYGGKSTQLLGIPNNETWEYDGATWAQITTTGNPGPRERPAMCFHAGIAQTVIFGGATGFGVTDETWLYDGNSSTWTQVATTGPKPSARNAAKMVYDSVRQICIMTGGQDGSGPLSDTWTFDGTNWLEQSSPTQPVRDHAFAFLPTSKQAVKFGGFTAAPNTLTDETWELGGGVLGTGCTGTNGTPSLTSSAAPVVGQSWTMDVVGLNPTLNIAFLVLGLAQLPGTDLGPLLGMPGCFGYATPDVIITLNGTGGAASWTWPAVAGPVGASLYAQALCLDPTVNAFGSTISNAFYTTLAN